MQQQHSAREFILRYFDALSGAPKTRSLLDQYISDQSLIAHIDFFENAFPDYKVLPDEITAEGNRVIVKARFSGRHEGELNGIPPTHRQVDFPFAIGYEINNSKISSHWMVVDRMALMEQLGVMEPIEK